MLSNNMTSSEQATQCSIVNKKNHALAMYIAWQKVWLLGV